MRTQPPPNYLTVPQAAAMLQVSKRTIQRWVHSGILAGRKINPKSKANSPLIVLAASVDALKTDAACT